MFRRSRGARAARLSAVVAAACLVIAACGGDDSNGATDTTTDTATDTATTGAAASTTVGGDSAPSTGGDVTMVRFSESAGFDPVQLGGYASGDGAIVFSLYDSLMRWDEATQTVVPQLAESLESTDYQTWTMGLRDGVKFSDGTPFDADAVIYNIERIQAATSSFGNAAASLITSMEAPDPQTVVFTLTEPLPHFDVNFTNRLAYIASPTAIKASGEDFGRTPVGAGPFVLDEWVVDDHVTLTRNPGYWNAPRPYLDSITVRPIPDNAQRVNLMTTGEAQMTYATDGQTIDTLTEDGFVFSTVALNGGEGLPFNTTRPPFDDPDLRRAVAYAINPDDFNNAVYNGHANLGGTLFSPESPFFDDATEPAGYDPDKAQEIFDAYRERTGSDLTFTYASFQTASSQAVGQFLQAVLGEHGVKVNLEVADTATTAGKVFAKDYDVSNWGLNIGGEPEPQLSQFFTTGSSNNIMGFSDPEMDAALKAAATEVDPAARAEQYATVQRIFNEQVPFLLLNLPNEGLLTADNIGGVRLSSNGLLLTDELTVS